MKWSDGKPATSEDACFSWSSRIDAIKDEVEHRLGLPRPGAQGRGRHQGRVPRRRRRSSPTRPTSPTGSSRSTSRSCPSTSGASSTTRRSATQKFDAAARRHRPVPRSSSGRPASSPASSRNPNYWGKQGLRGRGRHPVLLDQTDTMVQALKAGELDYAHDVNADQFKQLADRPDIRPSPARRTAGRSSAFNTYGTGTGKTIKGGGPSTKALLDPAFRDALGYAVDQQALVDRVLGGYGDVGHDDRAAGPRPTGTSSPTNAAHFDIDARQAEARRRRLHARRDRQAARQGRQADHPPARHPELERQLPEGGPVHRRTGTASSGSRSRPEPTTATRSTT